MINYKNYKVVEINNAVALRTGHMIAQAPLKVENYLGEDKTVVENGYILFLDKDGELKSPGKAGIKVAPVLHYTEELFTGMRTQLNAFAVPFKEGVAYPRGLVLHVGDTFTTDNVAEELIADGLYTINDKGQFAAGTTGHLFVGVAGFLPDADTPALELTYIGYEGGEA